MPGEPLWSCFAYANSYSNRCGIGHGNRNCNCHSDGNCDSNRYGNTNAYRIANAKDSAYTTTSSYTASAAVSLLSYTQFFRELASNSRVPDFLFAGERQAESKKRPQRRLLNAAARLGHH